MDVYNGEPIMGTISTFPYDFEPRGWFKCDGRWIKKEEHYPLFSLLSYRFGGDGAAHFALPNIPDPCPGVGHYIYFSGCYPSRN